MDAPLIIVVVVVVAFGQTKGTGIFCPGLSGSATRHFRHAFLPPSRVLSSCRSRSFRHLSARDTVLASFENKILSRSVI